MRGPILIALGLAVTHLTAAQQPSPFRSGVDLITVEASVVDDQSRPVWDLAAVDFQVKVGGQVRRVVEARYFESPRTAPAIPENAVIPAHATNYGAAPGRIVVFAVDRDAIGSGTERPVLNAATSMLDALGPADAAAAVALPDSSIDLSRDKQRVRTALLRMTGTRPITSVQFEDRYLSWDEALAYERTDSRVIAEVVERECRLMSGAGTSNGLMNHCPDELIQLSREMLTVGRDKFQRTMVAWRGLLRQLAMLRGTKHLVLLSGGLPFGQDLMPWYNDFARDAAAAEVIVHAIHLEAFESDVTNRKLVASAFGSRDFATGLGTLASMTGGAFYRASGTGAGIFSRITSGMTGFYQLGIETTPADQSGGAKPIDITVNRANTTVRYGRHSIVPAAADPGADRLTALLRQPTDIGDLPIALASYTIRGDEPEMLRLLVSAELGRPAGPIDWGFIVLKEGNTVATGRQRVDPAAVMAAGTLSAKLLPGHYQLRAAAVDAQGRAAVLELPISVGLRAAANLQFSDLILGTAGTDGRLQARSTFTQGEAISGLFEMLSADPAMLDRSRAVFEIAKVGAAEPLKRYLMAARAETASTLVNHQVEVSTAALPPGIYTASVVPHLDDQPAGRVSRRFEIVAKP